MLHLIRTAAVAASGLALCATAASAAPGLPEEGTFQADLLVTAVTATPTTGTCPAAIGDTHTGVVHFGNGHSATYRISLNSTTQFGVWEEIFQKQKTHDLTPSGSFSFGLEGSTLATGTFTTTYTQLDRSSMLAVNVLTYTSPSDGTTSCVETDQVTLIRVSD